MSQRNVLAIALVVLLISSITFSQDNRRTKQFSFPDTITGQLVGQCGNFDVLTDYVILVSGTMVYDKSGALVQTVRRLHTIGESMYYNSTTPEKSVSGGPGEVEVDRFDETEGLLYISGPIFKIRVPGYGLIFAETGHLVVDLTTGQVISNSGHNQMVDQDLAALCNYLK